MGEQHEEFEGPVDLGRCGFGDDHVRLYQLAARAGKLCRRVWWIMAGKRCRRAFWWPRRGQRGLRRIRGPNSRWHLTCFTALLNRIHPILRLSVGAAEYSCLMGAAYSESRREKAQLYMDAVLLSERALFNNSEFAAEIRSGETRDKAARVLGADDLEAMHFWVTALSYYFKECVNPLRMPFNMKWMDRSTAFLERMQEIDPDWNYGAAHFALGIYYLALPSFAGGDMELSRQSMDKAIEVAPNSLLARWGRAKYFFEKTGDRAGFVEDLEWVLAQDPRAASSPYPWNVYFQRDAKEMLDNVDRIF